MSDGTRAGYPLVYRASLALRGFAVVAGAAFAAGGVAWLAHTAAANRPGAGAAALTAALALSLILFGIATILYAVRYRVTLTEELVEHRTSFTVRSMRYADIAGFRYLNSKDGKVLLLAAREGAGKGMEIPLSFQPDDAFRRWVDGLPNLALQEQAALLSRVEQDPLLGATAAERIARFTRARRRASILAWACMGAVGWAIVYPRPYLVAVGVVAALPWLLLVLRTAYRHTYGMLDHGRSLVSEADLALAFMLPGFALALRALIDVRLIDWTSLVVPAIGGGLLLAALAGMARRGWDFLLMAAVLTAYPAGAITLANVLFERAAGSDFTVNIEAKHHTTGKGAGAYFTLAPWGPMAGREDVQVTEALYEGYRPGDVVCIRLYPGALGLQWYKVSAAGRCAPP